MACTARATRAYSLPAGMVSRPASTTSSIVSAVKARAMAAATKRAPCRPLPSCETLAARAARSAARAGSPGHTQPQESTKIWPPICSAITAPLRAIEPDSGAGMPACRLAKAVCSVETP